MLTAASRHMLSISNELILAGDIGGTKCNLALFQPNGARLEVVFQRRYPTRDYTSFDAILRDFRGHAEAAIGSASPKKVVAAGFGSAGAVVEGRFHAANLPWVLDGASLVQTLGIQSLLLLNDLEATAYSLDHLPPSELLVLNEGVPQPQGARALIAAGTGLGEAFLFWEGNRYHVAPSEGGQAGFAPRTESELELLRFLRKRLSHVSAEEVLAGRSFAAIHEFLDASVRHASFMLDPGDAAQEITQNALAGSCSVCAQTVDVWISAYGAEAGNLAIRTLAFGGIYVAGGIAIRVLPKLKTGDFVTAFCDKGNMAAVLSRIPIYVVLNESAPLWGAAYRAFETL